MNTGYIGDGYDLEGFIAAAPASKTGERLYDALVFIYRPAIRREVVRLDAEVTIAMKDEYNDPDAAVKAETLACKFVASKVKSWNLKDRNGNPVPVNEDACGRLHPGLFSSLYFIIRGTRLSDPKPPAETSAPSHEELAKN